jgi:hypothetical protein
MTPRPSKRRRAPFPRLPRHLIPLEIAYQRRLGRPWFLGPRLVEAPVLRAEDLTKADRARLLQRAQARARRLRRRGLRNASDRWWLRAELALSLSDARPATIRAWRWRAYWMLRHAEDAVLALRRLEMFIRTHEPAADAWLRRQLAGLKADRLEDDPEEEAR